MDRRYYVYLLLENGVGPIYVGKGTRERDSAHLWHAKKGTRRPLYSKIRSVLAAGGSVVAQRVATDLTDAEAKALEIELIAKYGRRENGGPLWNWTDGGDGASGFKHTPESLAAMRDAWKRRKANGWKPSPETLEKMRAAMTGRKHSEESKRKLSERLKNGAHWARGRKLPEYQKQAMLAAVCQPVEICGRRFGSMTEASKALGVNLGTLLYRCTRGKRFPDWRLA